MGVHSQQFTSAGVFVCFEAKQHSSSQLANFVISLFKKKNKAQSKVKQRNTAAKESDIRVFAENFVELDFFPVCFLYKINPTPRNTICCGKKWPKMPLFKLTFSWVGFSPWVGEFDGFIIICTWYMFPNPTEFGILQTPYEGEAAARAPTCAKTIPQPLQVPGKSSQSAEKKRKEN